MFRFFNTNTAKVVTGLTVVGGLLKLSTDQTERRLQEEEDRLRNQGYSSYRRLEGGHGLCSGLRQVVEKGEPLLSETDASSSPRV